MIVTKMDDEAEKTYQNIRSGRAGFYEQKRGLMAVWGKEAIPFLDGMVTNAVKSLENGRQMLAAFPNAQGRLLALVRMQRQDDKFLIETEEATGEKLFQNLSRFTLAGEFFVEDRSKSYSCFEIFGPMKDVLNPHVSEKWADSCVFALPHGAAYFIPNERSHEFRSFLVDENGCLAIADDLYERLRIEAGIPRYGIDMDETTVIPELGLDGLISYEKGCYIGQEIIARIHFRGHVAKQLTGLVAGPGDLIGSELRSADGKPAGKITSYAYSPKLDKNIAMAFIRYDYLAPGTELSANGVTALVTPLPFVTA